MATSILLGFCLKTHQLCWRYVWRPHNSRDWEPLKSGSCHMTPSSWKQAASAHASATSVERNMDNQLHVLLTVFFAYTCCGLYFKMIQLFKSVGEELLLKKFLFTPAHACPLYVSGHMCFQACKYGQGLKLRRFYFENAVFKRKRYCMDVALIIAWESHTNITYMLMLSFPLNLCGQL